MDGFPLWNERFIDPAAARRRVDEVRAGSDRYLDLLERKRVRRIHEPYAWFRPFNESTRALEPFRHLLETTVEAGVPILDLWCRTGWTGELLASWFPHNPVVSVWEGNHDHLGYNGFRHWLPASDRAPNLSVVFADPSEPLPFLTDHFALVHGLDTLHRYSPNPLVSECLRVARPGAPIVFPHIHLTNSEPEPFFERGCTQLHGTEWGDYLDQLAEATDRQAWVLSERDLYLLDEPVPLVDDRTTAHYNGFVALGPRSWQGAVLTRPATTSTSSAFVFSNPLITFDSVTGTASIDRSALSGTVGHMIDRHPIAVEALAPVLDRTLKSFECQVLAHARVTPTVGELSRKLGVDEATLLGRCSDLLRSKALQIESVSPAMAHLQTHYRSLQPWRRHTFQALWESLPARYRERSLLQSSDGSSFGIDDVDALVQATRHWFNDRGLDVGDRVAAVSANHVEYCVFVWAAWLSGLTIMPVSPDLATPVLAQAMSDLGIGAVAVDKPNWARVEKLADSCPVLVFDDNEDDDGPGELDGSSADAARTAELLFSNAIGKRLDRPALQPCQSPSDSPAAIVYTSGSSGAPKPVALDIASLLHTGESMAEVLELGPQDRLLSLAPTHTMSGLRNPHVAALVAGATIVAEVSGGDSALGVADACARHAITVLVASPTLIDRLAALTDRLRPADLRDLRTIATTADRIDPAAALTVSDHFGIDVIDYYGLTETGGVCVAHTGDCQGTLGVPVGAVVEVHIDDVRAPIDTTGEVRVSGPGVMMGYLDSATGVRHEQGWIHTGDLGIAHEDGSISLLGRMSEQIKRRNGEIYPHIAVTKALTDRPDVIAVDLRVEPKTRELVLHVRSAIALTSSDLLSWIEAECGRESLPDRLIVNQETR